MAWAEILGQETAKRMVSARLAAGTAAGAYLFAGPEGVGKRLLALELAKALNCSADGSKPCDACTVCQQMAKGVHPDLHRAAPSGASNQIKIDDIRHMLGRIALRPYSVRVQIAILENVERMTEEAANSLLKSLEEPTTFTSFLLTTDRLSHCLPTIVSRCQIIRCHALPTETVQRILAERHGCDARTADIAARLAHGSASRALELASRWTEYERLLERFADPEPGRWMETPLPESRQDVSQLLDGMTEWLRDLAAAAAAEGIVFAHQPQERALRAQAQRIDADRCIDTAFEVIALRESLEQFVSPRLVASLAREKWLNLITHDA